MNKIKVILLFLSSILIITQVAIAGKLTIINETNYPAYVETISVACPPESRTYETSPGEFSKGNLLAAGGLLQQ